MHEVTDSDQADDADIEWELYCSTREASLGFVLFTNLDLFREAMKAMDETRARHPLSSRGASSVRRS